MKPRGLIPTRPTSRPCASLPPSALRPAPALAAAYPGRRGPRRRRRPPAGRARRPGRPGRLFRQQHGHRAPALDRLADLGADAILAGAGRAADAGDPGSALREIATLSPAARAAVGPWRADAERAWPSSGASLP